MEQTTSIAYQRAWLILANLCDGLYDRRKAQAKLVREGLKATHLQGRNFYVYEPVTGRAFTVTV